eukprot:79688-Prymnesium_polylepis.1
MDTQLSAITHATAEGLFKQSFAACTAQHGLCNRIETGRKDGRGVGAEGRSGGGRVRFRLHEDDLEHARSALPPAQAPSFALLVEQLAPDVSRQWRLLACQVEDLPALRFGAVQLGSIDIFCAHRSQ